MTTSITIKIDTSNAAFHSDSEWARSAEVARILKNLANAYLEDFRGVQEKPLRDINGNTCGSHRDNVRRRITRSAK